MNKFITYLEEVFLKENPQIIKDTMPDAFDNWLSGLDGNDLIDYAEDAMTELIKSQNVITNEESRSQQND